MKITVGFIKQLSKNKDGNVDVIKLIRILCAKWLIEFPGSEIDANLLAKTIRLNMPDIEQELLGYSFKTYLDRAKYQLKKLKDLDYNYFVHPKNFLWMYSFLGNRQFSFNRGKGIKQKIRTEELVEFCYELTKRVVKAGGSKQMSRQYFLTMKDSLNFKLSYHKLSGMLRVLDELWIVHKSMHNIDEPATYTLGGHNPFKQLVNSKLKIVQVNKEITVGNAGESLHQTVNSSPGSSQLNQIIRSDESLIALIAVDPDGS
jgi:hypothetical protein